MALNDQNFEIPYWLQFSFTENYDIAHIFISQNTLFNSWQLLQYIDIIT
jgi:hypothetical protein